MPSKNSIIIFVVLLVSLAVITMVNTFLPQGDFGRLMEQAGQQKIPQWQLALSGAGMVLVLYGILGFIGMILAKKIGLPEIWDQNVTNRERFVIPAIVGAVAGILLIAGDLIFSRFNGMGRFFHPPFPTSIAASLSAGIGEELVFRLFFVSFWVWLFGKVILRGRGFQHCLLGYLCSLCSRIWSRSFPIPDDYHWRSKHFRVFSFPADRGLPIEWDSWDGCCISLQTIRLPCRSGCPFLD